MSVPICPVVWDVVSWRLALVTAGDAQTTDLLSYLLIGGLRVCNDLL